MLVVKIVHMPNNDVAYNNRIWLHLESQNYKSEVLTL